jgi:predicted acylesterase/phospholipase RssA
MATDEATPQLIVPETGPDQVAPEATTPESAALGLALSGGGVRAALFSLGVVIGLIESGCHRRMRCVASVSGGSILNAALAHAPSLGSFPSVEKFEPEASKLAARLAVRGVFAFDRRTIASGLWSFLKAFVKAFVPLVAALVSGVAFLADRLPDEWKRALAGLDLSSLPFQALGWIALASVLLSVLLSRGLLQELQYASVLGGGLRLFVKDWGAKEPRVMHVLVATDLLSGEPIYFSREFVYCKPYGWSTPESIRTAEALYSSAAFPAVFPPKKLKTHKLRFRSGDMPGTLPRTLRLADGGVYNNLGVDWFDVLNNQSQAPPTLWAFGDLTVEPLRIERENVIIVNASASTGRVPDSWVHWFGPLTLARIMSVLYDNTVKPRVKLIRDENRPLIDIQETPLELANRLAEKDKDNDVGRRAKALVTKLKGPSVAFWTDFSRDTAGTKTKLSPAGPRPAARLMLHGYLSSLVLLHTRFEGNLPERIRGERYFLKLVEGIPALNGGVLPHDKQTESRADYKST